MESGTAITEESIRLMVDNFYMRVREDEVLGPVFERTLHRSWDVHLPKMVDFWSTVLLGTGRFHGNVYGKHMALAGIAPEHFARWLAHFRDTVAQLHDPDTADEILQIANRIASSLQLGYFGEVLARIEDSDPR